MRVRKNVIVCVCVCVVYCLKVHVCVCLSMREHRDGPQGGHLGLRIGVDHRETLSLLPVTFMSYTILSFIFTHVAHLAVF